MPNNPGKELYSRFDIREASFSRLKQPLYYWKYLYSGGMVYGSARGYKMVSSAISGALQNIAKIGRLKDSTTQFVISIHDNSTFSGNPCAVEIAERTIPIWRLKKNPQGEAILKYPNYTVQGIDDSGNVQFFSNGNTYLVGRSGVVYELKR